MIVLKNTYRHVLLSFIFLMSFFAFGNFETSFAQTASSEKIFHTTVEVPGVVSRYKQTIETESVFNTFAINGYEEVRITAKIDGYYKTLNIQPNHGELSTVSELIFLKSPASSLEFIVENIDGQEKEIQFSFFNTAVDESLEETELLASNGLIAKSVRVISRKGWGADETIRYAEEDAISEGGNGDDADSGSVSNSCGGAVAKYPSEFRYAKVEDKHNGNSLIWPQQYSENVKKIFVHHTADADKKGRSNKEIMRAIYFYHTVSRGWGDIGYNFIIDDEGNIYEGRAGGDKVVGAHAFCNNVGSIGIALMGNFQANQPPKKQLDALIALTSVLSEKHNINPEDDSVFHGKLTPNIMGHRDVRATACPGENLYSKLPYVRTASAAAAGYELLDEEVKVDVKDYSAEIISQIREIKLKPTETKKLTFAFKNTGKETWRENNWLFVFGNTQDHIQVKNITPGKEYVAADMKETIVRPGGTATFEVEITAGYKAGLYTFEFTPVANGKYKVNSASVVQPISVSEAKIDYEVVKEPVIPKSVFTGQTFQLEMQLKNTGDVSWFNENGKLPKNVMAIGTERPRDRKSLFKKENRSRIGDLQETEVKPGEIGTFVFDLVAPDAIGIQREFYRPVINNVKWLSGSNASFSIDVVKPTFAYRYGSLAQKKTTMARGQEKEISFEIINLGRFPWLQEQITFQILNHSSGKLKLLDPDTRKELTELTLRSDIPQNGRAKFRFIAKGEEGVRVLNSIKFLPRLNGDNVFKRNIPMWIIVEPANLNATLAKPLTRFITTSSNESGYVRIALRNNGNADWKNSGQGMVYLKPVNVNNNPLYVKDKWNSESIVAVLEEELVKPGQTGHFNVYLGNNTPGVYKSNFVFQMQGNGKLQIAPLNFTVRVSGENKHSSNQVFNQSSNQVFKQSNNQESKQSSNQVSNQVNREVIEEFNPSVNTSTQNISTSKVTSGIDASKTIRVKLSFDESEVIIGGGDFAIYDLQNTLLQEVRGNSVRITSESAGLSVTNNQLASAGMRFVPRGNTILTLKNWNNAPAWNPDLNDNMFRGILELRIEDGKLIVINELSMKEYLHGLAEVSNSALGEKQKTLAVLARTYAVFYLDPNNRKFPGKPYDASDDPNVFQKYLGYGYELRSPNFTKAVDATDGLVVKYNNELVKTPYFNQSDGRTRSAQEVWGWTNTPYLVSVKDDFCEEKILKGHGVGLSGCGATELARQGKDFRDIIEYYYKDVVVEGY